MRRFLVGFLATVGGLVILTLMTGAGIVTWVLVRAADQPPAVAEGTILLLDLSGSLSDGATGPFSRLIGRQRPDLRATIDGIDRAAQDPHVAGIIAEMGGATPSLAVAQELAAAIARFRATGKYTAAFADGFGEGERTTQAYYLATAFERIWIQPSGQIDLSGFRIDAPYLGAGLKSVGVEVEVFRRHEFKSAADGMALEAMTPAVRTNLETLVGDLHDQVLDGVARARTVDRERLARAVAESPLSAEEATATRLIDRVGYRDQLLAAARQTLGGGNPLLAFDKFARETAPAPSDDDTAPIIALIGVSGPILRGRGEFEDLFGEEAAFGDAVARAIDGAARDRRVRAILLRIDSPGGSYVASDTIWRAVKTARAAGKPVVASLGSVAASGGYFVAMAAERIVTQPGTLTGSIGVVAAKLSLAGLWSRLGVRIESIASGPNVGALGPHAPLTPAQRARVDAGIDQAYADFAGRVAADRNLTVAQVDAVARGRVLTGRQAVAAGLADRIGGVGEAMGEVRRLTGLESNAGVLTPWPAPEPGWQRVINMMDRLDRAGVALAPWALLARHAMDTGAAARTLDSGWSRKMLP